MRLGDKLKKNFAKNLQILRTGNNLTQAKLADALNERYGQDDIELRRTSIVNYESVEGAMPRMDALYCIADYFGKTIDQLISPTMSKPVLRYQWLANEVGMGPESKVETPRQTKSNQECGVNKNESTSFELNVDNILTTCVDGIAYRKFYIEFLKKLFQQLLKNAESEEHAEKLEKLFHKTFLGCLIDKSKYLQDMAENMLDKQEFDVFMAFQDTTASTTMIAKALGMEEKEVVTIFNTAQHKISIAFAGNSK